ncbi:MAG: hypothetical protein R8M45_03820 [Ghiorsea sp.]
MSVSFNHGGFEVYKIYIALKAHFSTRNYDYNEYDGRTNVSIKSYQNRRDKKLFEILASKHQDYIVNFFISNFSKNKNLWIGDFIFNSESYDVYFAWKQRTSMLYKHAEDQMILIRDFLEEKDMKFDELFKVTKKPPIIYRLMSQEFISIETYLVMNKVLGFVKMFDIKLKDDIVYSVRNTRIANYAKFLNIDKIKSKQCMKNVFVA